MNKKLFIISLGIFLLINFGAVFISWQGRKLPPEPDDTGTFLLLLQGHKEYSSIFSSRFKALQRAFVWDDTGGTDKNTYFSWAFFWGKLARLFSLEPGFTLRLSFYTGIILFILACLNLFKEKDWQFKIFLVLILTLFTGDGAYHGLFWPTPSLYSVCFFLLIFKTFFSQDRHYWWKLCFLLPVFLLVHPLSFVAFFSLPSYFLLSFIFLRKNKKEKKVRIRILTVFLTGLLFYFCWFKLLYLKRVDLVNHTNLFSFMTTSLLKGKLATSDFAVKTFLDKYLILLLTRPFFLTLFVLGITKAIKQNKKIVFLLISFLPLIMIGLFFEGGPRILLFPWVLTFFIFVYGLSYLIEILRKIRLKEQLSVEKAQRLLLIMIGNLFLEFIWLAFGIKERKGKNFIIRNFLLITNISWLMIFSISFKKYVLSTRKKLFISLFFLGIFSFLSFLSLEKVAMVIFQKERWNFNFEKNIFLSEIKPEKEGLIIYNDILSFTIFSGSGLLDREVVRKGLLEEGDLERAAYFIAAKAEFWKCQKKICFFQEGKIEKPMKRITADEDFLLYEFF